MSEGKPAPPDGPVTIVTQTRVRPEAAAEFARWQDETSRIIAGEPGFLQQTVLPPSPPAQVDWVIQQRFSTSAAARAWLNSETRLKRLDDIVPILLGDADVHLVADGDRGVMPAPASMVVSTRVKPGREAAYRRWEQRIAAAQSHAKGFQGYRLEAPIPGVQESWLAILRFDNEANCKAWMESPQRQRLLKEADDLIEEYHTRIVRTGFEQWFSPQGSGAAAPPAWKQNMLVLLALYPVVFLFGTFVQAPLLADRAGLPFAAALFIGNVVSIVLLNYLVPWIGRRFAWWLQPAVPRATLAGTALLLALYAAMVAAFLRIG